MGRGDFRLSFARRERHPASDRPKPGQDSPGSYSAVQRSRPFTRAVVLPVVTFRVCACHDTPARFPSGGHASHVFGSVRTTATEMAHSEISELIPAPSSAVFDLLHDYTRRLEWDTLLQAAYLEDGATVAAQGVTAVCVGRRSLGGITLKTVYVTFEPPTLAAVRMLNTPPFFQSWAASIRHEDISEHESRLTYKFQFTTRPDILRFALEPLVKRLFVWETRKRLRALKSFFIRHYSPSGGSYHRQSGQPKTASS